MCMHLKEIYLKDPVNLPGFFNKKFITVPCGKCDECRVNHSREWALRCSLHYAALSPEEKAKAWFITLTYDDLHNPGCLNPDDMTLFFKRLRKHFKNEKIKYFYCGEYGSRTYRPHYHLIIFGLPITDLKFIKNNGFGDPLYTSDEICKIWDKGIIAIGELTYKSAAYTARYALKKNDSDCYQRCSHGFGLEYFKKHQKDIISNLCVTYSNEGRTLKAPIPRYFLKKYREQVSEQDYFNFMARRWRHMQRIENFKNQYFNVKNEFNPFIRNVLGIETSGVRLNRENKSILFNALSDLYKCREPEVI